ncbi:MAG: sensor histidine kinase [Clostridia bacterium]|nr:sensor histidine kinase [Clostridia bacterium]
MNVLITIGTYIVEYLIAVFFLRDLWDYRKSKAFAFALGAGLYALALAAYLVFDNLIVNLAVFTAIDFILALVCFRAKSAGAAACALFLTAAMAGTEFLTMALLAAVRGGDINTYLADAVMFLIANVFCKTLYFLTVRIAVAAGLRLSARRKTREPLFLFLFPLSALAILYAFWRLMTQVGKNAGLEAIVAAASVALIASVILTFVFYGRTTRKTEALHEALFEAEKLRADTEYYALLDRQNEQLKRLIHDEKAHLAAIRGLSDEPAVTDYIDRVCGQIGSESAFGNTGNKTLDLILNEYRYLCREEGVALTADVQAADLSFVAAPDLISLLNNMLDNAVTAAKAAPDGRVLLEIGSANRYAVITCTNSCAAPPEIRDGAPVSTKREDGYHGMGLKIIKKTAEKYRGTFDMKYDEAQQSFTVCVALDPRTEAGGGESGDGLLRSRNER